MRLAFDITRFEMQYPRFVQERAGKIIKEEMLVPIHRAMRGFSYSEKIIKGTTIENVNVSDQGYVQFDVVSDYRSESGFDVARAREEGTKRHFIKPAVMAALSWVSMNLRLFSKGHWVRGIARSNVIQKTVEATFPMVQNRLNEETSAFFKETIHT
jgi:hypothetical protein